MKLVSSPCIILIAMLFAPSSYAYSDNDNSLHDAKHYSFLCFFAYRLLSL